MQSIVQRIKSWIIAVVVDDINSGGKIRLAIRKLLPSEWPLPSTQKGTSCDL